MDTILSMVDFAASYNSDSNLRSRLNLLSGDRYNFLYTHILEDEFILFF